MSGRGEAIRLRQKMRGRLDERQPLLERWVGLMGDGEGNLFPDATDLTFVFVRRTGRGRVERVRNTRLVARNDLPVIVGFSPERPDEQQVLDTDDTALTTLGAYGYVRNHHQQHELLNPSGGDDTVWVFTQQFLHLLCQVTDPVSDHLQVRSGIYVYQGSYQIFPGGTTQDLTTLAPGAGLAVMVLISIDAGSQNLTYVSGTPFVNTLSSDLWPSQVPAAPDASLPVAAVYVANGATTFDWGQIIDWRAFINVAGDVQAHNILSTSHADSQAATLVRGDLLVVANTLPPLLARFPIGAAYELLRMNAGATDPEWGNIHASMMPHTILDGVAHTDTALLAVAQGMMMLGNGTPEWTGLVYPGDLYHLRTNATTAVWDQDIVMATAHWIGIGDGVGVGHIKFITDAGLDIIAINDADVGMGTETPNISGEALALTLESATGAPVIELSLKDDIFPADTITGIIRWFAGDAAQCAIAQIDVIQTGWYETESVMRFWAADDCALCLRQEIACDEVRIGDIAGGDYAVFEDDGSLSFQGDAVLKDPGTVIAQYLRLPGLRGFWPMSSVDYTAANRGVDVSGQGNHLTDNNTVEFGYDGVAPYVHFTAANNEYLSRADGGAANWADILGTETYIESAYRGLTFGGWFYFDGVAAGNEVLIAKDSAAPNKGYFLRRSAAGTGRCAVSGNGAAVTSVDSTVTMAASTWYFVVGRFTPSTTLDIYINATVASNAVAIPAAIFDGASSFFVGVEGTLTAYLDGRASMPFLCATRLSDEIILSLYERTRGMFGV